MNAVTGIEQPRQSLITTMAGKYGMDPDQFAKTVRATVMPANHTNEQFAALMLVANEYDLNPVVKEIYAFPAKGGGIVPIVSIDGWVNLVNSHKACDGFEFEFEHNDKGDLISCTCRMFRKDRGRPVAVTEYLSECIRQSEPWKMKHRMLRHKAMIQAARYAFGFSGIYDEDEGAKIAEAPMRGIEPPPAPALPASVIENTIAAAPPPQAKDAEAFVPSDASASTSDQSDQDDEPFDGEAVIAEIETNCSTIQTASDFEEVKALFAEDIERLTRSQRETADHHFEQAKKRLAKQEDKGPAQAESEPSIDLSVEATTPKEYAAHVEARVKNASGPEGAQALNKWWFETSELRDGLKIPAADRDGLKKSVFNKLSEIRDAEG